MDPLASLPPPAMGTTLLPTAPTLQTPTLALASPLKATPAPSAVGLGLSTLSAAEPSVKVVTSPHELTQFVRYLVRRRAIAHSCRSAGGHASERARREIRRDDNGSTLSLFVSSLSPVELAHTAQWDRSRRRRTRSRRPSATCSQARLLRRTPVRSRPVPRLLDCPRIYICRLQCICPYSRR